MASKILNLFKDPATKKTAFVATSVGVLALAGAGYWWWSTHHAQSTEEIKPVTPENTTVAGAAAAPNQNSAAKRGRYAAKLENAQARLDSFKKAQGAKYTEFVAALGEFAGGKTISVEGLVKLHAVAVQSFEKIFGKLIALGRQERRQYIVSDKAIYEEIVIENHLEIQELFKENLIVLLSDASLTWDQLQKSLAAASGSSVEVPAFEGRQLYAALIKKVPATADLEDDPSEELANKLFNTLLIELKQLLYTPSEGSYAALVKEKLAFDGLFTDKEIEEEDLLKLLRKYTPQNGAQLLAEFEAALNSA